MNYSGSEQRNWIVTVQGLPTVQPAAQHFLGTQAVQAGLGAGRSTVGSRIVPKTLNSWASVWTVRVEPGRGMAPCLAMLRGDSHPRSGQRCACDSRACCRQDAEACWGGWQLSGIAPGGGLWLPTYSLRASCFGGWEHCYCEWGPVWYAAGGR